MFLSLKTKQKLLRQSQLMTPLLFFSTFYYSGRTLHYVNILSAHWTETRYSVDKNRFNFFRVLDIDFLFGAEIWPSGLWTGRVWLLNGQSLKEFRIPFCYILLCLGVSCRFFSIGNDQHGLYTFFFFVELCEMQIFWFDLIWWSPATLLVRRSLTHFSDWATY